MRTKAFALILASLVTMTACGSSSSSSSPSPSPTGPSADITVTIQGIRGNQSYAPSPITMRVGQTIAWHNNDGTTHTATGDAGGFDTGSVSSGANSSAKTMTTAGTFTYHCAIHGSAMVGTITVQ